MNIISLGRRYSYNRVLESVGGGGPPPPPPNDPINDLLGPIPSKSQLPQWYIDLFVNEEKIQWDTWGDFYGPDNTISLYERGAMYYMWWVITGNPDYLQHGHDWVQNYKTNYLIPSGNNPSPHFSNVESLYLHWRLTGDPTSRDIAVDVARHLNVWKTNTTLNDLTQQDLENRIQTRVMMSEWIAERLVAEGYVPQFGDPDWTAELNSSIDQVLSIQHPSGYWSFINTCGQSWNYQMGMLADLWSRLYEKRNADPRILASLTLMEDYLWTTQWLGGQDPTTQGTEISFKYVSGICEGSGGPDPAPDLNGFYGPLYGFLYAHTNDLKYIQRGDNVFFGIQRGFIERYRQFSEEFHTSPRYRGWRSQSDQNRIIAIELDKSPFQTLFPQTQVTISATPRKLNGFTSSSTVSWNTTDVNIAQLFPAANTVIINGLNPGNAIVKATIGTIKSSDISVRVFIPQLIEPFTDLSKWTIFKDGSNVVSVANSEVTLNTAPSNGSAGITTTSSYSLMQGDVELEISQTPSTGVLRLALLDSLGLGYQIELGSGVLAFTSSGTQFGPQIAFDPVNHKWWNIRALISQVEIRTSPDGVNWTSQAIVNFGSENRTSMKATIVVFDQYFGGSGKVSTFLWN